MTDNVQIPEQNMARALAPEDILIGEYVAFLSMIEEIEPFVFTFEFSPRTICAPKYESFPCSVEPMKVRAVCLPYVFIKDVKGKLRTLDVRQVRLARLPKEYGSSVWKCLRKKKAKDKSDK